MPHTAMKSAKRINWQMAAMVSVDTQRKRGESMARGEWHLVVNLNVVELAGAGRFVNMRG